MGNKDNILEKAQELANIFAEQDGRRPRIMLATMHLDDKNLKRIATNYADIGFDVDIGSCSKTPAQIAKQAIENDVHILNISSAFTKNLNTLVTQTSKALKTYGRNDIIISVTGEIQNQDYPLLLDIETVVVFELDTKTSDIAINLLELLIGRN